MHELTVIPVELKEKDIDFNNNDFGELETLKDIKISKIKETGITIC